MLCLETLPSGNSLTILHGQTLWVAHSFRTVKGQDKSSSPGLFLLAEGNIIWQMNGLLCFCSMCQDLSAPMSWNKLSMWHQQSYATWNENGNLGTRPLSVYYIIRRVLFWNSGACSNTILKPSTYLSLCVPDWAIPMYLFHHHLSMR